MWDSFQFIKGEIYYEDFTSSIQNLMVKETLKHLVKVHTFGFHYNKTLQYAVEIIDTVKASTINSKKLQSEYFKQWAELIVIIV